MMGGSACFEERLAHWIPQRGGTLNEQGSAATMDAKALAAAPRIVGSMAFDRAGPMALRTIISGIGGYLSEDVGRGLCKLSRR
ncbi:hypothetical protein B5V01_21530 [Mesorhizobium erdmanii]|uniref:Uncharacterized protein n=3 Tax=Phyllobacteriaceae TaxID=69277 RepID=A0A3M9X2N4_9HYPH|nr:hypothetical protein DNR46_31735 [Mesorhizobium japonicum]RXT42823.1 hypothetical protein B5V01_21530 [Mesorhizobium erdmanii]